MQVTINRNDLLEWLSVVERAIPGKSSFAPVEGVYMSMEGDSLTFCANDLEMAIRLSTIDVKGDGAGATVLPKRFVQIAKQLPGDEVKITIKDDRAVIKSGSSKFKLNCMDAESFPIFDEGYVEKPSFNVEGQALKEMIGKTTFCVAGSPANPVFQGVYVSNHSGNIVCMASDTYRLACYKKMRVDCHESFEAIIPGKLLAEVGRIVSDSDKIKVYIGNNELVFTVNDYAISARLLDGKYPDLKRAFPENPETKIKIDQQLFASTINRARLLANKQSEMISLSIADVLEIKSQSEVGQMNEELPIHVEGEPLEQLFINAKYLLEGVKAFDDKDLHIDFHGETGPIIVKEAGFRYLVLPIKAH
jgi:DNA polymerase-3 subunit beta